MKTESKNLKNILFVMKFNASKTIAFLQKTKNFKIILVIVFEKMLKYYIK